MDDGFIPEALPPDDPALRRLKKSAHDALRGEGKEVVESRAGGTSTRPWTRSARGGLVRVLSGGVVEMMMAYKETLFPDDPRFVIRWELVRREDGICLNGVSGLRGTRSEDGEPDAR